MQGAAWWRGGALYQIYPRSFADTNADGIGDLPGVVGKLDYLQWLGIDAIWLNPITPSPNADWGYDVSDYCDVHPELGTLADVDRLVQEARSRGIQVLIDIVPNHSSDRHPWFAESRASRTAARRDWYVWADPRPDGSPPNNWLSIFGGPAWTLDEPTGQFYLHNFLPEQPDLNWWNEEVREAFDDVLRFWLDRGIAGFRIDVAHGIVKDRELRDNPPPEESDEEHVHRVGQRQVYNFNRPEVHEVLRRWRALADRYDPPGILVGETWAADLPGWAAFYGSGDDELHLAFNFPYAFAPLEAAALRSIVEATEGIVPSAAWPLWTVSNHDIGRFPTRVCDGDETKARCALFVLLALKGTPVLYSGDEIAMPDVPVPAERKRDRVGRDPCRTPMQWTAEPEAGFTAPGVEPWLPLGDAAARNVVDQRGGRDSMLSLCRDLLALRRALPDLREGAYSSLPGPDGVWAWRRGRDVTIAVNLSDEARTVAVAEGSVRLATNRDREGTPVTGELRLDPWDAVLIGGTPAAEPA